MMIVQNLSEPLFWVEVAMLSALLSVGFYTTCTDLKFRRVPNRCTFILLAIGLAGQTLMVYLGATTFSRMIAVLLVGLAIAFGLTLLGFWAPGDAKLFWAASITLPPSLCPSSDPFSLQAPPGALVLNALLCYLLVLLMVPFWRRDWRKDDEHERPGGRQWLLAALGMAGLLGLTQAFAFAVLEGPITYLEAFAALVIGYRLLERGVETRYWPVLVLPGMAALVYLGQATHSWKPYVLFWGVAWLVELVYLQVRFWYNRAFVQVVPVGLLQAGVVPRNSRPLSEVESETDEEARFLYEAGKPLSEKQVSRLHTLARENALPGGDRIEVEQAIPFVPFITAAAVLTAFFAGNLVPPLTELVVWLGG